MRVTPIRTRQASARVRGFFSRLVRGHAPAVPVARREIPYWQERGWTRKKNEYTGAYRTPYGSFFGHIEDAGFSQITFLIYAPSEEIRRHSHWVCFAPRGGDWFMVHMERRPQDVSSGIIAIERLITEAYQL